MSIKRIKSSSSMNNLAGKLYSEQGNRAFTPKKILKPENRVSFSVQKMKNSSLVTNPEMISSARITGLETRTSHVPCFAEMNTDLLKERKRLQERILLLKQAIASQKKKANQAELQAKKNENETEKISQAYKESQVKAGRLSQQIEIVKKETKVLSKQIKGTKQAIDNQNNSIKQYIEHCDNLYVESKNLKMNLMQEQKQRGNVKNSLSLAQKLMTSSSVYCKQLENERSMLLVQINQSVEAYKL